MLDDGKTYVVRIDGNDEYTYMKEHVRLVDGELFVLQYHFDEDYYSLDHLCKQYALSFIDRKWIMDLLLLMVEHLEEIVSIIEELDLKNDMWKSMCVDGVKGLTVSNF